MFSKHSGPFWQHDLGKYGNTKNINWWPLCFETKHTIAKLRKKQRKLILVVIKYNSKTLNTMF